MSTFIDVCINCLKIMTLNAEIRINGPDVFN